MVRRVVRLGFELILSLEHGSLTTSDGGTFSTTLPPDHILPPTSCRCFVREYVTSPVKYFSGMDRLHVHVRVILPFSDDVHHFPVF